MTAREDESALARALQLDLPVADDHLTALRARLADAADADGVLDVAYRTMDTPVGLLLLAATERGLVRVAYASEDHDAVLQMLADRISPRILRALPALIRWRPSSRSTSPGTGAPSTCRWTGGCRPASGTRC